MVEARRRGGEEGGGGARGERWREARVGYDGEALVLGTTNRWDRLSRKDREWVER